MLDPNHNNFILVDDGLEAETKKFGKEINFRASLEAELHKPGSYSKECEASNNHEKKLVDASQEDSKPTTSTETAKSKEIEEQETEVPMVLIVVQGGPNTLKTVEETLLKKIPVLILAGSKGCADLISNACSQSSTSDESLRNLIISSRIFKNEYDDRRPKAVEQLQNIVKNKKLINVFKLDSEEGSQTIELAILRSFLNSRQGKHYENLKLCLQWNRVDMAKLEIFTVHINPSSTILLLLIILVLVLDYSNFILRARKSSKTMRRPICLRWLWFTTGPISLSFCLRRA